MLDFRMETFLEACRTLNFTRAAEALNITQPAVTQHIQYLEKYYGTELFEYRNKQLRLTPAGEQLRWAATAMVHDEQKLKRDLQDLEKKMSYLPDAEQVFLGKCGLDNEELAALRERERENYKVVWTVQLGKKLTARTDDTTFMPVREHVYYFLDDDAYNLRYCEEMLCVDVGHMGLTNIDFVSGMPHLQFLILAHNGQLQDISPISSCKELIFLELDWSAVKDFSPLVGCTSLEDLNIGLTYPSVEPLMQMPWLKNLWMVERGGGYQLSQALPDTKIVATANATVGAGWRNLPNYYKMRDMLGMEYMKG